MDPRDVTSAFLNSTFVDKVTASEELRKQASVSATSFIRDKLREEGFLRKVLTPIMVSDDQLDKDLDSDKPMKIIEKEPDSTATYLPFRGTPDMKYFTTSKFPVYFGKIASQEFTKSIWELKTNDNDIRKILGDNSIRDIQAEEDGKLIDTADTLCAANPSEQDFDLAGGLTRVNLVEAMKYLPKLKRPNGLMLMNDVTAKEILKWDSLDFGDSVASDTFYKGLTSGTILGLKSLFTIKRELVTDNRVYFFSTEDFLGKFFILQDATMFIEHRADMLKFFAYEVLGFGIGNTKSIIRVDFT